MGSPSSWQITRSADVHEPTYRIHKINRNKNPVAVTIASNGYCGTQIAQKLFKTMGIVY